PAGSDPLRERRRIEIDVEGVAVRRHPARGMDADRRDLPRPETERGRHPDARQPLVRRRFETERPDGADDRPLEVADIAAEVSPVVIEVEDRVADELAGPVLGLLAPAFRLDHRDVDAFGYMDLRGLVRPATERDDRLVLESGDHVTVGVGHT